MPALAGATSTTCSASSPTGGYALRPTSATAGSRATDGRYRVAGPGHVQRYRMNVGTIVEAPTIKVKLKRGRVLGEVEEYFVHGLTPGDSFIFAGELLTFEGLRETWAEVARGPAEGEPQVPAYCGGRLPLSTHLAERVRGHAGAPRPGATCRRRSPSGCACSAGARSAAGRRAAGRDLSARREAVPGRLLLRGPQRPPDPRHAADPAHGARRPRPARLRRHRLRASRSGACSRPSDLDALFAEDMLGDDLEEWMAESSMLRRTFRNVAVIAGLIERAPSGPGEDRPPGHLQRRPDLRRAAQARAGPHPAARDPGRRRRRPDRHRPPGRHAGADQGPDPAPRLDGSRPWPCPSCWRSAASRSTARPRRAAGRGRPGADHRGHRRPRPGSATAFALAGASANQKNSGKRRSSSTSMAEISSRVSLAWRFGRERPRS